MSHDRATNDELASDDDRLEDRELRHLLQQAWPAPDPSADFVENTLLRISAESLTIPEPSADYVDRVLAAVAADRSRGPARTWRLRVAAALLAAAAIVLALLPRDTASDISRDTETSLLPPPWRSPLIPSGFPGQGVLPVGRSVALVRAAIPAVALARDGSTRQDRRPTPTAFFPPPPPILVEAGLLTEPEPWGER